MKVKHLVNCNGLVKLKSNNRYFQSVKQNGKAGAYYIVTGHSVQALVSNPSSIPGQLDNVKEVRGKLFFWY